MGIIEFNEIGLLKSMLNNLRGASCNIDAMFPGIKQLGKDSASNSIQYIYTLPPAEVMKSIDMPYKELFQRYADNRRTLGLNENVFLKVFSSNRDLVDGQLIVEILIYQYLTRFLVFSGVCPNIMYYLMDLTCGDINDTIKQELKSTSLTNVEYRAAIIEEGNGVKFVDLISNVGNYWTDPSELTADMALIMFQIFYTCAELYYAGVIHNDLHPGNVWIQISDTPIKSTYYIKGDNGNVIRVTMTTRYTAKIYDFDHASFTSRSNLSRNPLISYGCTRFGECAIPDKAKDLSHLMYRVVKEADKIVTRSIIDRTAASVIYSFAGIFYTDDGTQELYENAGGLMSVYHKKARNGWYCNARDKSTAKDIVNRLETAKSRKAAAKNLYLADKISRQIKALETDLETDQGKLCRPIPIPMEYYNYNYVQKTVLDQSGNLIVPPSSKYSFDFVPANDIPERSYQDRNFVSQEIRPLAFKVELK